MSNVGADQLRTAMSITGIAAVTVHLQRRGPLAWQLHRTAQALPIPGTTSVQHLKENLAAADIG